VELIIPEERVRTSGENASSAGGVAVVCVAIDGQWCRAIEILCRVVVNIGDL